MVRFQKESHMDIKHIIPSPPSFFAVYVGGKKVDYCPIFGFALCEQKEGKETLQVVSPLIDGGPTGLVAALDLENYVGVSDKKQLGDDRYWIQLAAEDVDDEDEDDDDDDDEPEGVAKGSD